MNVYIVLCDEWSGADVSTSIEEVFLNEEKAEAYAEEMKKQFSSFYYYVLKREVKD